MAHQDDRVNVVPVEPPVVYGLGGGGAAADPGVLAMFVDMVWGEVRVALTQTCCGSSW